MDWARDSPITLCITYYYIHTQTHKYIIYIRWVVNYINRDPTAAVGESPNNDDDGDEEEKKCWKPSSPVGTHKQRRTSIRKSGKKKSLFGLQIIGADVHWTEARGPVPGNLLRRIRFRVHCRRVTNILCIYTMYVSMLCAVISGIYICIFTWHKFITLGPEHQLYYWI